MKKKEDQIVEKQEQEEKKLGAVETVVAETVAVEAVVEEAHPVVAETGEVDALTEEAVKKGEEALESAKMKKTFDASSWMPKTDLGKRVKSGELTSLSAILDSGENIMEPEIVDFLMPNLESDLLLIGQAKGKFGGGQRRLFRQTQKKTKEGNKPKFSTFAIIGNKDGYIGLGYGKSKETVPAREKAMREAKINVIKIKRGNGSWEDQSKEAHTIPYAVTGKCGSVRLKLMPAPKGTGLCVEKECQKVLRLAGIKNVWSKSLGNTATKMNMILACMDALRNLSQTKSSQQDHDNLAIVEGSVNHGGKV